MLSLRSTFRLLSLTVLTAPSLSCGSPVSEADDTEAYESLITSYIESWKDFYPSRAASLGLESYRGREPDRSSEGVEKWVAFNDSVLGVIASAPTALPLDVRIDLRLIRKQGRTEVARWGEGEVEEEAGLDLSLIHI